MLKWTFRGSKAAFAILGLALAIPTASAHAATKTPVFGIKGGHETKMCEWPTTTWLRNCTATLIHPQVVIYAAHCGSRISNIFFGEEDKSPGNITPKVKFCKTYPGYKGNLGDGVDYAFCLLEEPMEKMPIAPIGYGCELEQVNPKNPVWLVGFGINDNKEGRPTFGVKRMVKTIIGRHSSDGSEIELGKLGFVSSKGDSGGPAYIKLTDGTWRTVGITSWGSGPGPNWYVSAAEAVPWIHKVLKEEGYDDIDVTPCYEDDGTWAPSEECGGFALDPGTAYGTYKEQCAVDAPLSGPSSICGEANPNAKGGTGIKPPSVEISSPEDEEEIEEGQTLAVKAKVKGVAQGKKAKVTLLVSDKARDALKKPPYTWELDDLEVGTHELVVQVEVESPKASAKSKPITVKVVAGEEKEPSGDDVGSEKPAPSPDDKESPKEDDASNDGEDSSNTSSSEKSGDEDSPKAEEEDPGRKGGCSTLAPSGQPPAGALGLFALLLLRRRAR